MQRKKHSKFVLYFCICLFGVDTKKTPKIQQKKGIKIYNHNIRWWQSEAHPEREVYDVCGKIKVQ